MTQRHAQFRDKALKKGSDLAGESATQAMHKENVTTVSVYRVLQMRGGGYADVLPVLQVHDNKADAVPCERLQENKVVPLIKEVTRWQASMFLLGDMSARS
jgi:hypothetical protein